MNALRSIPCHTDEELQQLLEGDRLSLKELAQYNGTVPGATAIANIRDHMERVEREVARRRTRCPHGRTLTSRMGNPCPAGLHGCEVL